MDTKVEENAADKVDIGGKTEEHHVGRKGTSGEEETDGKGALHGADYTGTKHSGIEFLGPIDTRITVLGAPRAGRISTARDWRKRMIARPLRSSPEVHQIWRRGGKDRVVRNAIGLPVYQTNADNKVTDIKSFEGTPVGGAQKSVSPAGNGGTKAIGTHPHRQGFVPLRAGGVTTNPSIIDGTGMGRPSLGMGTIGGAKKNVAGVIDERALGPGIHDRRLR